MHHDIKIDGYFVNVNQFNLDNRVKILDLPIYQLSDFMSCQHQIGVVLGHSHYELASELEVYPFITNVWCFTDAARPDIEIAARFIKANQEQFHSTYNRLSDQRSKQNFISYLNAKLTKDVSWILTKFDAPTTYFENDVLSLSNREVYLDLGVIMAVLSGALLQLSVNSATQIIVSLP